MNIEDIRELRQAKLDRKIEKWEGMIKPTKMELVLAPGESRGYWKYHTPEKWFKQAEVVVKINNEKTTILLDSGAEISIVDTAFARKVGCVIDENPNRNVWG